MNANVGRGEFERIVGKFGFGQRNEDGDRHFFYQMEELVIMNTWFQYPPISYRMENLHKMDMETS